MTIKHDFSSFDHLLGQDTDYPWSESMIAMLRISINTCFTALSILTGGDACRSNLAVPFDYIHLFSEISDANHLHQGILFQETNYIPVDQVRYVRRKQIRLTRFYLHFSSAVNARGKKL